MLLTLSKGADDSDDCVAKLIPTEHLVAAASARAAATGAAAGSDRVDLASNGAVAGVKDACNC